MDMRRNLLYCIVSACVVMLFCGCDGIESRKNSPIRINVTTDNTTKSVAITSSSLEAAGKFVLDVIVDDSYREVDSEGHPVGPTYSAGAYVISGGKANVLYSSASNEYTPAKRPGPDHTEGWYIYADDTYEPYYWIDGVKMHFWARYPQDSDVDGSTGKGDLSVTIPGVGETTEDFEYALPEAAAGSDATNQKDILFAYAERTKRNTDLNDNIDIVFHHPLSEVRFCVSPDDGTFDVNLQIKRIEITNVPDGGSCTFDSDGTVAYYLFFFKAVKLFFSSFYSAPITNLVSYSSTALYGICSVSIISYLLTNLTLFITIYNFPLIIILIAVSANLVTQQSNISKNNL